MRACVCGVVSERGQENNWHALRIYKQSEYKQNSGLWETGRMKYANQEHWLSTNLVSTLPGYHGKE